MITIPNKGKSYENVLAYYEILLGGLDEFRLARCKKDCRSCLHKMACQDVIRSIAYLENTLAEMSPKE